MSIQIKIESKELDSRRDEAKELALNLIWAGTRLLHHHELFQNKQK